LSDYRLRQAGWEISYKNPDTGADVYIIRETRSLRACCELHWLGDNVEATVFVKTEPVEYAPPIDILVLTSQTVRRIMEAYPNAKLNVPDEVWLTDPTPVDQGEPWPEDEATTPFEEYGLMGTR
jgi:hypothetical protein